MHHDARQNGTQQGPGGAADDEEEGGLEEEGDEEGDDGYQLYRDPRTGRAYVVYNARPQVRGLIYLWGWLVAAVASTGRQHVCVADDGPGSHPILNPPRPNHNQTDRPPQRR